MDLSTWALFVPACFALNLAPGPNNLLSVHNATHHGFSRACWAGIGRLVAFAGMIGLAAVGLAVAIQASAALFMLVKIVGATYLLYLAWQLWCSKGVIDAPATVIARQSTWGLARQEFLVAAGNPKAILIFTAFLPQFVSAGQPFTVQFVQLGAAFLLLEWIAIALYACAGVHLRRLLKRPSAQALFSRCCASLLALAGVALLLGRKAPA